MSILSKIIGTKTPSIEEQMKGWDDRECLQNFMKFIPRVGLGTDLIQDEHGFITHKVLQIQCGGFVIVSPPIELDWPLEPVVFPEEHKGRLN